MKSWFSFKKKQDPHGSSNGLPKPCICFHATNGALSPDLDWNNRGEHDMGSGRAKRSLKMDPNGAKLVQLVRCMLHVVYSDIPS